MFVAAVGCAPLQPVSSTSDKKRYVNNGAFAPVRQHFTPKAGFPDMVFNAAAPDCRADWQPRSTVSAHLYLMARTAPDDRALQGELKGYAEYGTRVRSRLCPASE